MGDVSQSFGLIEKPGLSKFHDKIACTFPFLLTCLCSSGPSNCLLCLIDHAGSFVCCKNGGHFTLIPFHCDYRPGF